VGKIKKMRGAGRKSRNEWGIEEEQERKEM
jgi:hypothetical protein